MFPYVVTAQYDVEGGCCQYACQLVWAHGSKHAKRVSCLVQKPAIERIVSVRKLGKPWPDFAELLVPEVAQSENPLRHLIEQMFKEGYEQALKEGRSPRRHPLKGK